MDKQKQIEEMVGDIKKVLLGVLGSEILNLAYFLDEQGYHKIPENAVVLTEGDYSDLLSDEVDTIERDISEYWVTQEIKSVAKELHKDGYRKLDDHAIMVLRNAKGLEDKIRKETAEKFAERLKEMAYQSTDWSHGVHPMVVEVDYIDEIAEEFTGDNNGH